MSVNRYRLRLERQARGAPVAAINAIPILLAPGEDECKEDNESIRDVHRARLSIIMPLRASANAADARLERKLRFNNAKLKAKGKLQSQTVRYAPVMQHESAAATSLATSSRRDLHVSSSIPASIGGKRQWSQADPERDVRKRQRRMGSPAEEALHTSRVMRLRVSTPLNQILVLTVASTFLENFLHMALNVPLLIEKHRRRPVYRRKRTRI